MTKKLMAEQWNLFEKILPRQISEIQRREMKRAFYAGVQCILFKMIQVFAHEGEVTEEDLKIMENVHQELQDFAQAVKDGRA